MASIDQSGAAARTVPLPAVVEPVRLAELGRLRAYFAHNPLAMLGLVLVTLVVIVAAFAPLLAPTIRRRLTCP